MWSPTKLVHIYLQTDHARLSIITLHPGSPAHGDSLSQGVLIERAASDWRLRCNQENAVLFISNKQLGFYKRCGCVYHRYHASIAHLSHVVPPQLAELPISCNLFWVRTRPKKQLDQAELSFYQNQKKMRSKPLWGRKVIGFLFADFYE